MDASDIARLRELCAKATPGPWGAVPLNDLTDSTHVEGPEFASARSFEEWELTTLQPQIHADAAFIASTRTAVPALLDALEDARRERDEARAALGKAVDGLHELNEMAKRWRAEAFYGGGAYPGFVALSSKILEVLADPTGRAALEEMEALRRVAEAARKLRAARLEMRGEDEIEAEEEVNVALAALRGRTP